MVINSIKLFFSINYIYLEANYIIMKYLTNLTFIMLMFIFTSCSTGGNHPDYASNVEKIKTFLELQGSESDSQAQADMIHEDVQWQPAFYGTAPIGKAEFVEYLIAWQDAMEDVVYTPTNYLPGVNAETGELDGSVRSYGTWTGVHSESGKSWELSSYHTWDFQDGLVINGGDYFDAGGFLASLSSE